MKRNTHWHYFFVLPLLALLLQGCLGIGEDNGPFQSKGTAQNGESIRVNTSDQAKFSGKIYLTLDRNLYMLDNQANLKQLTHGMDVRDPAVSPDGKWIAFIRRYKYYSDLVYMSTNPGDTTLHTVVTGNGQYTPHGNGENSYYWFAQPSWSADSAQLLFLSDLQKDFYWQVLGGVYASATFLDMQLFSLPISVSLDAQQAKRQAQPLGYAVFGDGGLRDPSYRPNHPEQVLYTTYRYGSDTTKQLIQVVIEDTTFMTGPAGRKYHPGFDPSVALTPEDPNVANLQATFSPDGNTILYVKREDRTHMSLYSMPVAENVANNPNNPYFDPNNPNNLAQALIPYKTQSSKLLTDTYLAMPVWSPDGKQLIYYKYTNNKFDLWLATFTRDAKTGALSIKGNSDVQITQANGHLDGDSHPLWVQ